jgi:hypothetical protein
MFKRTNTLLVLIFGIALLAMLLLAAGVSELELLPGSSAPVTGEAEGDALGDLPPEVDEAFRTAFRIFAVIIVVGLPLMIIYSLLTPEARKNLLKAMVPILLFGLFLYLAMRASSNLEEQPQPASTAVAQMPEATPVPEQTGVAATGEAGELDEAPPGWLLWGTIVSLALIVALVMVGAGRFLFRYRTRQPPPLAELATQAEEAAEAIRAGVDLQDTVILCYYRMSQTLQEQRGIWRETAMTPREFETYLARSGLPGEPVQRLTRLFEKVRYGAKAVGAEDKSQALSSLGAIVEYCRSAQ